MNQIKLIYTSLILLTLWVVSSCTYRKIDKETIAITNADKVYYDPQIKAFIAKDCGCHLPDGLNVDKADLSTYDKVQTQAEKMVKSLSEGGAMFTYATGDQIQMLKVWIHQGTPENATSGDGGGNTNPTYTADIQTYIATGCSCHVSGSQTPSLSTLQNLKQNVASLAGLDYQNMGTTTPTQAQIDMYANWVKNNYPN